jgi:hypothetical protein
MNCFRFGIISSLVVYIYATSVQNVDPEEYGGIIEIIKEGLMTAFATFLVRKNNNSFPSCLYLFYRFLGLYSIRHFILQKKLYLRYNQFFSFLKALLFVL